MMKHIILCADDYGQTRAISQAIIDLVKQGRITAVSCMVTERDWAGDAALLFPYKNQVDIGLHFNLTEGKTPLIRLLVMSHLRLLDNHKVRAELHAQLDKFIQDMDMLPDFIDGHQHVHQFPIIRDVLLDVYEERLRKHGCYIRSIDSPYTIRDMKKLILQLSGASAFKKKLLAHHVPHNASFSGVYHFNDAEPYESCFKFFLKEIKHRGLMMCHPGLVDGNDVIAYARPREYNFIKSERFLQLLDEAQVKLVRFNEQD